MKRTELKSLVKEIVRRTVQEMNSDSDSDSDVSYYVNGQDVTFENIQLGDGRSIAVSVQVEGFWDDGAFDHEFGTHRYPVQFEMEGYVITNAWDMKTNAPISISDPNVVAAVRAEMDKSRDDIVDKLEAPDREGEDADREMDRRRDDELLDPL